MALKWRLNTIEVDFSDFAKALNCGWLRAKDLWIVSAVIGTVFPSFLWILTLSKLELYFVSPF